MRTAPDWLGVEWVYPVGRDPTSRATLALETIVDGRACRTRADFDAIGLKSGYHTCLIFGCEWQHDGVRATARFFLVDSDSLCVMLGVGNVGAEDRQVRLRVVDHIEGNPPVPHDVAGDRELDITLEPGEGRRLVTVLARGTDALLRASQALQRAERTYAQLLNDDAAFAATCPILVGDWPSHWREGLHHDFQTTRLLVQPPGGIFQDVWPAWMAGWPRVVLAEGTLDMLRLAYADASTAKRAVLSLFRDAPQSNVPCVFEGGEYNMVAADGSLCGTSPAWCLPFVNLQLLYLRTLDREWLAELYPHAEAYLDWWLRHRTDADGWIVYKCTWESGEDGNPRLDPTGSGDADISKRVRPAELQATVAHAAGVLAFFAGELGRDGQRWRQVEHTYRERTRQLYDASSGRYRDWLIDEQRPQDACPERLYWGLDPCRYSAQSLTPFLVGLPLDEREVWRHAGAPWTLWPSWTWSLVESAAAAGLYPGIGRLAFDTIDRVYRATTRRELGSFARPLPGSSPEYWPQDWRTYGGSDAYGWGATTANLLIRHLFGFKESTQTHSWVAELTPALPEAMLTTGAQYGIRRLNYRGLQFDLTYVVVEDGLIARLTAESVQREFKLRNGEHFVLNLR